MFRGPIVSKVLNGVCIKYFDLLVTNTNLFSLNRYPINYIYFIIEQLQ